MFEGGRLVPKLRLHASSAQGTMCVKDQRDADRNRHTRVAEVRNACTGALVMPALTDVVLVGSFGESWTLSRFENVTAGLKSRYRLQHYCNWVIDRYRRLHPERGVR